MVPCAFLSLPAYTFSVMSWSHHLNLDLDLDLDLHLHLDLHRITMTRYGCTVETSCEKEGVSMYVSDETPVRYEITFNPT